MSAELKLSKFARFAWFVLAYNVVVILWGVFLRASKSGDGCGQHWLTCHGEVIPSAPEMKTVIEFSHRMTSASVIIKINEIKAVFRIGLYFSNLRNVQITSAKTTRNAIPLVIRCENSMTVFSSGADGMTSP